MRRAQLRLGVLEEGRGFLGAHDPLGGEGLRVLLANRRMIGDLRDHQRLRVRGLVLLVVAEAAIADEIDDDVAPELLPVRHREPYRRDRGLGIVGVDVDDGNVEALGEVARVARRPAFPWVGREPDLVVGDQVQGAARRVALQAGEVERFGHDSLAGERRVAVDEDRQRDRGVVEPCSSGAIGLIGARPPHDDGVDGLQVARIRRQRDRDLPHRQRARAGRGEVVLHVARASLGIGDDGVHGPLALELAENRLVGPADCVREHVEAASVRHSDDDLVGAGGCGEPDRLVEHRHHRVEPLERELLLAQEAAPQIELEALDLRQSPEQRPPLLCRQRLPVAARLDRLAQPDTLGVVGDVLDLVGDRAAVDVPECRQRLEQRLAGHVDAENGGRDARLELRRQGRNHAGLVERGVAERLGAERIEASGEVAVHAVGLDERHRCCDGAEQRLVDLGRGDCSRGRRRGGVERGGCRDGRRGGCRVAVATVAARELEQSLQAGMAGDQLRGAALEEPAPLFRHRLRVLEVVLEQKPSVA